MIAILVFTLLITYTACINNGKGITPPMGWRSWNLYNYHVDQDLMITQMGGLTSRTRLIDGEYKSLADLGYSDIGLDDAWQLCGSYGPNKYTYHDVNGNPVVNTTRFPSFNKMTEYAHSLGLTAGWYGNNCICQDHCDTEQCYRGDVNALINYGFDSIKLDNCGVQTDLTKWASIMGELDKPILIENCHWGFTRPNATWCPWNIYRTSQDIKPYFSSVISNLLSTVYYAKAGLSTPGCWSYPDMLEVGVQFGPVGLTYIESRTHFGAWCIVSSPLILSHDLTNDTTTDLVWDIITNTEAIAVNQAWYGDSGTLFATSDGEWQLWSKKLSTNTAAVLIINISNGPLNITLPFYEIPSIGKYTKYDLRDIWGRKHLGVFADSYTIELDSHDSSFLKLTAYGPTN